MEGLMVLPLYYPWAETSPTYILSEPMIQLQFSSKPWETRRCFKPDSRYFLIIGPEFTGTPSVK